ncbi:SGNH/GDSL hydrolase family protein [Microvirga sp. 17 mud 1-3]|uniref:SGNH/GDSL hydrolase family protein n=1 Tax=Microvirga sp. 17 mud 1-3 TaxID=2082949 RepID=UPI0013A5467F|nr:SGNH/GDSL hydrolase family protein [Microvirga sp. 17 mud 1-3]
MSFLTVPAPASAAEEACGGTVPVFRAQGLLGVVSQKLNRHETVRILAIGSSSTEGIGASAPDRTYPAQLQEDLSDLWHQTVTVVNAGIGGEKAVRTVERLEEALKSGGYDLVIWQVGTNDAVGGVPEDGFRTMLERGIAAAKAAGVPLILLDQQYVPTIRDPARYERFVQMVARVGETQRIPVFSRYAMMKEWGSHSLEDLRSMLSSDSFHMSDKGYRCLADRLAQDIQSVVARPVAEAERTTVAAARRR